MASYRAIVVEALRSLQRLADGDEASADELAAGLAAARETLFELHAQMGPLEDVDVAADTVAGENKRIRVAAGADVAVTLPNAVLTHYGRRRDDFGPLPRAPAVGSTGQADGVCWRAPRDGARIEIVGTTFALWFYRADLNQWLEVHDIALDDEIAVGPRLKGAFATLTAERLAGRGEGAGTLAPADVGRARAALLLRPDIAHPPVRAEYF